MADDTSETSPSPVVETVTITGVAYGGDGVAQLANGMTVFVPFAAPGDQLSIQVESTHRSFARASIVEVVRPGPDRVEPQCQHFQTCGGCHYQHIAPKAELQLKVSQLEDLLRRVGGLKEHPKIAPVVASPTEFNYRNKITLHAISSGEQRQYGYYARDNETIIPIANCPLGSKPVNRELRRVMERELPKRLVGASELVIREDGQGKVVTHRGRVPKQATWLHESLGKQTIRVPQDGFYQVNPPVLKQMLDWLRVHLDQDGYESLLDIYCGCGVFALSFADLFEHVVGLDSHSGSIATARRNARDWGLQNCAFVHGRASELLGELLRKTPKRSRAVLLIDPPRQGCSKGMIRMLNDQPVATFVYVSCNAATLARDLGRLLRPGNYRLDALALFDMFPQTASFESVAVLSHVR